MKWNRLEETKMYSICYMLNYISTYNKYNIRNAKTEIPKKVGCRVGSSVFRQDAPAEKDAVWQETNASRSVLELTM